jgi:hypothetical protein
MEESQTGDREESPGNVALGGLLQHLPGLDKALGSIISIAKRNKNQ